MGKANRCGHHDQFHLRIMSPDFLLNQLLPHWPGVIYQQRLDGSFAYISPRIEEWTGIAPARWQAEPDLFWQLLHEHDAAMLRERLRNLTRDPVSRQASFRLRHPLTGRIIYLAEYRQLAPATDQDAQFIGYWQDITAQKQAELRLNTGIWKDTLTAVTLGFAHDFNNLLTGILSLSEAYLSQMDAQNPLCEGLALIKNNSRQATQLIQRLVHLHYDRPGLRSYQDLNTIMADTSGLLRRAISRRYEITSQLAATSLPLYVDPVELRQAIITLTLNSLEVIGERGHITFETSRHEQWPAEATATNPPANQPAICLTITARATGPKTFSGHSSDPCLSAQTSAPGSQIGLQYARFFTAKYRGWVSAEPQDGMIYRLWLPESDFTEADPQAAAGNKAHSVLVVGPQESEALHLADVLRNEHFKVVTASGEAFHVVQSEDYTFEAVIILVPTGDSDALSLIPFLRRLKLPIKAVIRLMGCRSEAIPPAILAKADLIVPSDVADHRISEKLESLWA